MELSTYTAEFRMQLSVGTPVTALHRSHMTELAVRTAVANLARNAAQPGSGVKVLRIGSGVA